MSSVPLSEQPENVRALFISRASGRTITPEQLYDKVPSHLTNNPEDVVEYMEARDVSRITSGHNGGDYTDENTVLELSGPNRARGATNITSAEVDEIHAFNAANAADIDSDTVEAASDALVAISAADKAAGIGELAGPLTQGVLDCVLPAVAGAKVYQKLPKRWNRTQKAGTSAAAALATLGVVSNPVGAAVVAGIAIWKASGAIHRLTHPGPRPRFLP